MSVCLLFPPPWDTSQPYLSTAALAQHLKSQNVDVFQADLNLRFVEYLCDQENFAFATQRLEAMVSAADQAAREGAAWNLQIRKSLERNLSLFDETMRSQTLFYDSRAYFRAQRLINKIYDYWSAAYFATQMTPISFRTNLPGNHLDVGRQYANDRERNPIIRFIERYCDELEAEDRFVALFGLSIIYDDQIVPSLAIAKHLKTRFPGAKIVLGGGAISQYARIFKQSLFDFAPDVDFVVVDDGYALLTNIAHALRDGQTPRAQGNLLINGSRRPVHVEAPVSESFWVPPDPDFDGLPLSKYHSPEPVLSFKTSKGCKWSKCTFCSESAFKEYSPAAASDVVASIIRYVASHKVKFVNFADSDISPPRFTELSQELIRRGVKIGWSIRARFDPLFDARTLELGALAGCRKIFFGFESASQRLLKLMKKGTNISNVTDILRDCRKSNILTHLFSFVGFPTETVEEAIMTRDFLWNHIEEISSFNIGVFQLRTFSDAFSDRRSLGITLDDQAIRRSTVDSVPYEVAAGVTQLEARALQEEFLRFFKRKFVDHNLPYEMNKWSGYINLRGAPYWDSHNLAYADYALSVMNEPRPLPSVDRIMVPKVDFEILRDDSQSVTLYLLDQFRTLSMSRGFFDHYRGLIGGRFDRDVIPLSVDLVAMGLAQPV